MEILKKHTPLVSAVAIAGLILLNASCAVRPGVTEPERQAARTFTAPAGKAVLFVYRPRTVRAMAVARPIFINGEHVVSNTNGTFVAMPLKPGTYRIQAAAQALIDSEEQKKAFPEIVLTAREGKSYFIRQSVEGPIVGSGGLMMLQTGGAPIPLMMGNDPPPFRAALVDESTGKWECSGLELVGSDPVP